MELPKYDYRRAFEDPVVRCFKCQQLILMENVKKMGICPKCGGRRVSNVLVFNDEEKKQMKEWNIDPEFLERFEEVPDV